MKSREFIREAIRNGWVFLRQGKGSHEIYEKEGKQVVIPNHGAKENRKRVRTKIKKRNGTVGSLNVKYENNQNYYRKK